MKLGHKTKEKPIDNRSLCNPAWIHVHMWISNKNWLDRVTGRKGPCFKGNKEFSIRGRGLRKYHYMTPVIAHSFPLDCARCMVPGFSWNPVNSNCLHGLNDSTSNWQIQVLVSCDDNWQMLEEKEQRIRECHMITHENGGLVTWSRPPFQMNPLKSTSKKVHPGQ